jgi:hypothetical protein
MFDKLSIQVDELSDDLSKSHYKYNEFTKIIESNLSDAVNKAFKRELMSSKPVKEFD